MTQADVRVWSALPKSYSLAIVPSGEIKLNAYGKTLKDTKQVVIHFYLSK